MKRINPFTGEPLPAFEVSDASAQIAQLRKTQQSWRQVPVKQRCERLLEALDYFEAHRESIAKDICQEMGRPLAQARGEIDGLLERARYLASIAEDTLKQTIYLTKLSAAWITSASAAT